MRGYSRSRSAGGYVDHIVQRRQEEPGRDAGRVLAAGGNRGRPYLLLQPGRMLQLPLRDRRAGELLIHAQAGIEVASEKAADFLLIGRRDKIHS